jgi:hypothetical protein
VKLVAIGNTQLSPTQVVLAFIARLGAHGQTLLVQKGARPSSKSRWLTPSHSNPISTQTDAKYGALGRGVGAVSKGKSIYKSSSANPVTRMCKDGNATAKQRKTMETSTGELIAKLTNLSHNLALELRFKESSLVLEAVGALHTLPNIAETIRNSWHPSMNDSGPSKGLSYISSAQLVDADE